MPSQRKCRFKECKGGFKREEQKIMKHLNHNPHQIGEALCLRSIADAQ